MKPLVNCDGYTVSCQTSVLMTGSFRIEGQVMSMGRYTLSLALKRSRVGWMVGGKEDMKRRRMASSRAKKQECTWNNL